jgi:hypothetical protein
MKTQGVGTFLTFALVFIELSAFSQVANVPVQLSLLPPATEWRVAERGPHHRVMERTVYELAPDGSTVPRVRRYTELATGMHYKGPAGQWLESDEKIEVLPLGAGAAASKGQHKVIFPADLYDGQIELQLPDQSWLRSRVMGLSYFDTASGASVLIAETVHSVGRTSSCTQTHSQVIVVRTFVTSTGSQVWNRMSFCEQRLRLLKHTG